MLQGATHSRTILGVTTSPPRVALRDSEDETGLLRCVVPADLDGQQYQLVVVRPDRLSEKQALARRSAMMQGMAQWKGSWDYDETFPLRFDDAPPSAPPSPPPPSTTATAQPRPSPQRRRHSSGQIMIDIDGVEHATLFLNVYDIAPRLNRLVRLVTCGRSRWGLYHSGVAVYGAEYCYGGHPEKSTGVSVSVPRQVTGAKFRTSVLLGHTAQDPYEVRCAVAEIALDQPWEGRRYHPLSHNCNEFSAALAEHLGATEAPVPPWVNSFTSSWIVKNVLPCIERLQSSRLLTRLFCLEPVQPEVPGAPPFECHPEDAMEAWAKDSSRNGGAPRPMSMNAVLLEAAGVHKTRGGNAYRDGRTTAALEAYRKGSPACATCAPPEARSAKANLSSSSGARSA